MHTTCRNGNGILLIPQPSLINIPFRTFVIIGTSLPFFGVIICTLVSLFSSFEEVTESVCGVSNFVPSISAVTGITPQLYFWRYAVGLHSAPRFLLAATYYQYHKFLFSRINQSISGILVNLSFLFNLVDVLTFIGVAFVSNRENFPVHEGMFVVFLFASSLYMLTVLIIHWICQRERLLSPRMQHSLTIKLIFFLLTMLFIALLVYHIYFHRFECRPNAFSWFSATEYGIAIANMGFHMTAAYDFQDFMLTTTMRKPSSE